MSNSKTKVFRLQRLAQAIQGLFDRELGQESFWVKAEIAEKKRASSGHYYLNLVEEREGIRLASMSAVIWKIDFEYLQEKMPNDLESLLQQGQELVLKVLIDFHPNFGLKLIIKDIDLSFSLGELERRRQENLKTLESSGKIEQNRSIPELRVWQRIAVVSSPEAAALKDFYFHLKDNEFGYHFGIELFPSKVQGAQASEELRRALLKIDVRKFDCIALIRGGGSSLDLDAFNDLKLCETILELPLPVLSGIGHESDWTLVDRVAKSPHKTPTALADYLIDKMNHFEAQVGQLYQGIANNGIEQIRQEQLALKNYHQGLQAWPLSFVERERGKVQHRAGSLIRATADGLKEQEKALDRFSESLKNRPQYFIREKLTPALKQLEERIELLAKHQFDKRSAALAHLAENLNLLSPKQTLKRGYSITRKEGKSIVNPQLLQAGDQIETELEKGKIYSIVKEIQKHEKG